MADPNPLQLDEQHLDEVVLQAQQAKMDAVQAENSPTYPRDMLHKSILGTSTTDDVLNAAKAVGKQQADGKLKMNVTMDTLKDETFYAVNHAIEYVGAKAIMGRKNVTQSIIYSDAFFGGKKLADAKREAADSRMEELKVSSIDPIEHTIPGNLLLRIFGETAAALPALSQMRAGAIGGSVIGAALGAAGGPAAPITMTGGVATGGVIGGAAAGIRLGIGGMYKTLTDAGVDENLARAGAFGAGAIDGILQQRGSMLLEKVSESASAAALRAPATQQAMHRAFTGLLKEMPDFGKEIGQQTFIGMAQELTNVVTEAAIGRISDKNTLNVSDARPLLTVLRERFVESFIANLTGGIGTVGGAKMMGAATQYTAKKLAQKDLVDAVKAAAKAMDTPTKAEAADAQAKADAALQHDIKHAALGAKKINMKEKVSKLKKKIREAKTEGKPTEGLKANLKLAELQKQKAYRDYANSQTPYDAQATSSPLSSQERRSTIAGAQARDARKNFNRLAKGVRRQRAQGEKPTSEQMQEMHDAEMTAMTAEENARTAKLSASIAKINKRVSLTGSNDKLDAELRGKLSELTNEAISGRVARLQAQLESESQFVATHGKDGTKTGAVNKAKGKVVKLRQGIYNLKQAAELLKTNALSAYALESYYKDIQSAKTAELFREASRMVLRAGVQGRGGGVFDVGANRKALEGLISASGLPRETRNKLPKITEIDTPAKLQGFLHKLEEAIHKGVNKKALEEAHSDLNSALELKTFKKEGKFDKGTMSYGDQKVVQVYKKLITDSMLPKPEGLAEKMYGDALAEKQALELKASTQDLTDTETARADGVEVAMLVSADVIKAFSSGDTKQLKMLAGRLEELIKTGKSAELDRGLEKTLNSQALIDDLINKAQGRKPSTAEEREARGNKVSGSWDWKTHGDTFASIQQMWGSIFRDSRDKELPAAIDPHDSVQKELTYFRQSRDDLSWTLTGGVKRLEREMARITNRQFENDVSFPWTDQDGVSRTFTGSVGQAMKARNMLKNPNRRQGLVGRITEDGEKQGNRITFEQPQNGERAHELFDEHPTFETAVNRALTADQHLLADRFMEFYSSEKNLKPLQEMYVKAYKLPMPTQEVYDGPGQRVGAGDPEGTVLEMFNKTVGGVRTNTPGSMVKLTENNFNGYEFKPIVADANQYIKSTQSWRAMYDLNATVNRVFANEKLRAIIEDKTSKDTYTILKTKYQLVVGTRAMQHIQQDRWDQKMQTATGIANTAGKFYNAIAQVSGIVSIAQKEGFKGLYLGTERYWADPIRAHKLIADTQYWVNRRDTGDNVVLPTGTINLPKSWAMLEAPLNLINNATGKVVEFSAGGIRAMDYFVHSLGFAAYHAEYLRQIKKNPDDQAAAHTKALGYYERVMNQTQGSSTKDQHSYFQDRSTWHAWASQFMSQPRQAYMDQVLAVRDLIADPSLKNTGDIVRVVVAAHFAQGLFQTIKTVPDLFGEDDRKANDAITSNISNYTLGPVGIPIVGDSLATLNTMQLNRVLGTKAPIFDSKNMKYEIVNHLANFIDKVLEGITKGDASNKDLLKALDEFTKGPAYLLPGNAGKLPLREGVKQGKAAYERNGAAPVYNEPTEPEAPVDGSINNLE